MESEQKKKGNSKTQSSPAPIPSWMLFFLASQWPHLVSLVVLDRWNFVLTGVHCGSFWIAASIVPSSPSIALMIGMVAVIAPWFTYNTLLGRAWYGLASCCVFMRLVSIIRKPDDFWVDGDKDNFRRRLAFMYWVGSDLRTVKRVKDAATKRMLTMEFLTQMGQGLLLCSVTSHLLMHDASLGFAIQTQQLPTTNPGSMFLGIDLSVLDAPGLALLIWRWLLSFTFFYNSLLMVDVVYNFPLLFESMQVEPMMNQPLSSTSLQDFWAVRWDRAVQMMLKDSVYVPMRRCGCSREACVCGTFVASALLHCYGIMCGGTDDAWLCASIVAFFCIQPPLLFIENAGKGKRNLAWTLIAASPFFLQPVCKLFESIELD
jgi:hypothetical protein